MTGPGGRDGATVVIGLGNPLMTDDGIGLAALGRLRDRWEFPPGVCLVDGGTWGMSLLPEVEDAGRLLLLDAIDVGVPPGRVVRLERDELPLFLSQKLSPHQVGLRDVLAVAELRGTLPAETVAMGLQPAVVELSTSLSPEVQAGVERLARRAVEQLAAWGQPPAARREEAPCTS